MKRSANLKPVTSSVLTTENLTFGLDLGDKWAQLCALDSNGDVIETGRVKMNREALSNRFDGINPTRIAIEAGTHSLWVSEHLTAMGHEVIVANVCELRAISGSDRKHDRCDAEKLARYARVDPSILRPIKHRTSEAQSDLTLIRARAALVRARTLLINAVRGLVKPTGHRVPTCTSSGFANRCREILPSFLRAALMPMLTQIAQLTEKIEAYDEDVQNLAATKYSDLAPLRTVYGVGALTALTFVLTLGDKDRFVVSRDVGCYLGLRPRRSQSGEYDPQLPITKAGDRYLRTLLVEAAHLVLGPRGPDTALRRWGRKLAERGGKNAKKRAIIAVARKLAILLHRLWVTPENYRPFPYAYKTAAC